MLFLLTRSFHNVVSNNVNAPPNLLSFPFDCIEIRFKTKRDVTAGLGGGGGGRRTDTELEAESTGQEL